MARTSNDRIGVDRMVIVPPRAVGKLPLQRHPCSAAVPAWLIRVIREPFPARNVLAALKNQPFPLGTMIAFPMTQ